MPRSCGRPCPAPGASPGRLRRAPGEVVAPYEPDLVVLAGWMRILTPVVPRSVSRHQPAPGPSGGVSRRACHRRAFAAWQAGEITESGVMVHWVPDAGVDTGPVDRGHPGPTSSTTTRSNHSKNVSIRSNTLLVGPSIWPSSNRPTIFPVSPIPTTQPRTRGTGPMNSPNERICSTIRGAHVRRCARRSRLERGLAARGRHHHRLWEADASQTPDVGGDGHRHRGPTGHCLAREGGIGVLHRNLSIEEQADQVDRVKRAQSGMINDPVSLGPDRHARRRRGPDGPSQDQRRADL